MVFVVCAVLAFSASPCLADADAPVSSGADVTEIDEIKVPGDAELFPKGRQETPVITPERRQELRDRGIYSGFGPRSVSSKGVVRRYHNGIDISGPRGSVITAFNDGAVVFAGQHRGYGLSVIVRQLDGRLARYAHMSGISVAFGDTVRRGQHLGKIGRTGRATGVHLHFELIDEGAFLDPSEHIWLASELVLTPDDLEALQRETEQRQEAAALQTSEEHEIQ